MDPNATLRRILEGIYDDDWDEACAASHDLHRWLSRGGFAPDWESLIHPPNEETDLEEHAKIVFALFNQGVMKNARMNLAARN